jgi:hypothetical protein
MDPGGCYFKTFKLETMKKLKKYYQKKLAEGVVPNDVPQPTLAERLYNLFGLPTKNN